MQAPPKVAWREFQDDGELEFEFYLAHELRMPVGELRERMTQAEFVQWWVYIGRKAQRKELAAKGGRRG